MMILSLKLTDLITHRRVKKFFKIKKWKLEKSMILRWDEAFGLLEMKCRTYMLVLKLPFNHYNPITRQTQNQEMDEDFWNS